MGITRTKMTQAIQDLGRADVKLRSEDLDTPLESSDPMWARFIETRKLAVVKYKELFDENAVDIEAVVPAFVHALTAERPKTRYYMDGGGAVFSALVTLLPDHVQDSLFNPFSGYKFAN